MPVNVTMEEPCTWVVCSPSQNDVSGRWNGDGVSSRGVLCAFLERRVDGGIVGRHVKALGDDLEFVSEDKRRLAGCELYSPVQVERMESSVPVIHRELNVLHVLVGECTGLGTVDLAQEGVFSHRQGGEDRRDLGRDVSHIVETSSVCSIVVGVKEDIESVLDIGFGLFSLLNGDKLGIIDDWIVSFIDDLLSIGVPVGVHDLQGVVEHKRLWDRIVHVFTLPDGKSVVGVGLVLCLHENRVSLSDRDGEQAGLLLVDVVWLDIHSVRLDKVHIVILKANVEHFYD